MNRTLEDRMQRAVAEQRAAPLEAALLDWALRHGAAAPVALALAACARAVAEGHSCLSLADTAPAVPGEEPLVTREELEAALRASELVGGPGDALPLILDGERLYLQRYWAYETRLAQRLGARLAHAPQAVNCAPLQRGGELFDYGWIEEDETHWQAVAAFVALRHRFAVISGGPGTGKTYTVLRLMRLLIEAALTAGGPAPLIRLAAPTGKAAARMMESTRQGLKSMALPEPVRAAIPTEAQTLHRLIGIGRRSTRPRHTPEDPLAADVVIVDEASMVDLPMMAKLIEAVPDEARLILLGDRYQLASVESGSVLAELCNAAGFNAFSPDQQSAAGALLGGPVAAAATPLADHIVTLTTSHRFHADSAIGRLAAAVNAGDAGAVRDIAGGDGIDWQVRTEAAALDALVADAAVQADALRAARTPADALPRLQRRALLCALRHGPAGSLTLNRRISEALAQRHGFDPGRRWYHGRPVIVTRNDYRAGLFNGDTGVCLADEDGHLRVWFATEDGARAFLPSALPEHETVYAMTVHKSQGSEFDHVTLLLPPGENRILSRELLYTGITRARESLTLYADPEALAWAIARRIERHSGLAERLSPR